MWPYHCPWDKLAKHDYHHNETVYKFTIGMNKKYLPKFAHTRDFNRYSSSPVSADGQMWLIRKCTIIYYNVHNQHVMLIECGLGATFFSWKILLALDLDFPLGIHLKRIIFFQLTGLLNVIFIRETILFLFFGVGSLMYDILKLLKI